MGTFPPTGSFEKRTDVNETAESVTDNCGKNCGANQRRKHAMIKTDTSKFYIAPARDDQGGEFCVIDGASPKIEEYYHGVVAMGFTTREEAQDYIDHYDEHVAAGEAAYELQKLRQEWHPLLNGAEAMGAFNDAHHDQPEYWLQKWEAEGDPRAAELKVMIARNRQ
jgi:hypothetical protein